MAVGRMTERKTENHFSKSGGAARMTVQGQTAFRGLVLWEGTLQYSMKTDQLLMIEIKQ